MKKSVLLLSLLSGTALVFPDLAIASGLPIHTLTGTSKPAPTLFIDTSHSFKLAGVCFLGVGACGGDAGFSSSSSEGSRDDFTVDGIVQCLNEGFTKQNCNSVQTIDGVCPYNSAYGLGCKCASNLISCPAGQVGLGDGCNGMYASCQCDPNLVSCSVNQIGIGAQCGGKFQSCGCRSDFQYDVYNCTFPRSLTGESCDNKYAECVCPTGEDEGPYGCAEYYPSPCASVCKVAYTDNCHAREAANVPYYCEKYWDDCPSKCEIAADDNCVNRTGVSAPYGCQSYYDDCPSECEIPYPDNCRNRSEVSIPSNAVCSSKYSDCSSKCSAWTCQSGYYKSGNSCLLDEPDPTPSPSSSPSPSPSPSPSEPLPPREPTESECRARYPDYDECADRGPCTCDRRHTRMPGDCSKYYQKEYWCASW